MYEFSKARQSNKKRGVPKPLASHKRGTAEVIAAGVAGAINALKGDLSGHAIASAANAGNASRVVDNLNWSIFLQKLGAPTSKIAEVVASTAKAGVGLPMNISQKLSFNLTDPRAIHYAQTRAGALLTAVTEQQKELVRSVVTSSLKGQASVDDVASTLSRVVGLNHRQAIALENQYQKSIALHLKNGATMTQAMQRATDTANGYRVRLIGQRADMIARTEIMYAENAGRLLGFQDAVEQGLVPEGSMKQWSVSGLSNMCDECAGMDGETVGLDEIFSNGEDNAPAHPNCECTILLITPEEAAA